MSGYVLPGILVLALVALLAGAVALPGKRSGEG